mgnify:CR=1 FL=1
MYLFLLMMLPLLRPVQVREDSSLLSKVVVVGGDISLPGLGLSPSDRAALSSSVNFIIHCAADIRLEADIQVSDRAGGRAESHARACVVGGGVRAQGRGGSDVQQRIVSGQWEHAREKVWAYIARVVTHIGWSSSSKLEGLHGRGRAGQGQGRHAGGFPVMQEARTYCSKNSCDSRC